MTNSTYNLKHPEMGIILLDSLLDLGDKSYQLEKWVDKKYAYSFWGNLVIPISHLFDVLNLEETPEDQIEYSLYNKK